MTDHPFQRHTTSFLSQGERCAADLYLPTGGASPPVVIMAHGLGGQRAFGLAPFAERFAGAGLAVLLFDYRGFADSEGEPRQLVDGAHHVQDYLAAIAHVRDEPRVDGQRVGLWGTSYSGGHVLVAAADSPDLRCVVSQVPFVDGVASALLFPPRLHLPALAAGLRDATAAALGRPAYRAPIVAERGLRVLASDDCVAGYEALIPDDADYSPLIPARIFLTLPRYRPITAAPRIQAPVLMIGATLDSLIPIAAVRKTAARIPDCELVELDIGHFDPYSGPEFERVVRAERDFLVRHLLGDEAQVAASA